MSNRDFCKRSAGGPPASSKPNITRTSRPRSNRSRYFAEVSCRKSKIMRLLASSPAFRFLFRRQLQNFDAHFLAGLEFHGGAGGNGHIGFRFIRIAPDARLADFDFEDAEVAQFHRSE